MGESAVPTWSPFTPFAKPNEPAPLPTTLFPRLVALLRTSGAKVARFLAMTVFLRRKALYPYTPPPARVVALLNATVELVSVRQLVHPFQTPAPPVTNPEPN